ncbi:single-stranded-DNA-specific exonuclease RecJ [Helicobacter enhydrae]|uniref:Single-stranded-DNA-specific exonuclease RecJ n=1 Tax=Helicobacter enhydrae TaxID=222136 RepID=A0A1B1U509_9HELI|nr:single-stranded-DNA-specific exonuclease RecJ [Helicobacter enhydrae]ANV97840.1 single-stranded-DNA-specific exonuclease RecJ [Helicobacter enhydrae]
MIGTFQELESHLASHLQNITDLPLSSLPHPFELENVKEASEAIAQAIQKQQKILIVGDYDADGILSTALMVTFFKQIGIKHFSYTIPHRFNDGYGISIPILERNEADLIITVDNGITATDVAQYCKAQGKTLIITDHHSPKEILPDALIINPQVSGFAQKEICGCFVAWYVCAGLKATLQSSIDLTPFLEFVSIATISDIMPLTALNRTILKKGLSLLNAPHFAFAQLLLQKYGSIDEECIGFFIAPLLNASGRMADTQKALDFLFSQDIHEAQKHFEALQALNTQRKEIQKALFIEAKHHLHETRECVVAYGTGWHEGVLGILANQLLEQYQKPTFVLTQKDGSYKGSGRGVDGVDLPASLNALQDICNFGGHCKAVGLEVFDIEQFCTRFQAIRSQHPLKQGCDPVFHISPTLLTAELLALLQRYGPYGEGYPQPSFTLPPLPILEQKLIGKEKNHTQFTLQTPKPIKVLAFFQTLDTLDFAQARFYAKRDAYQPIVLHLKP